MRSYQTRKHAFHIYSPGAIQRRHTVARHVQAVLYGQPLLLLLHILLLLL